MHRLGSRADFRIAVAAITQFARAGENDEALRLAHEAIKWAGTRLEQLGDAYRDLGEVEQITGRADGAQEALEAAIAAYERKGMGPMAERTRGQLLELREGPHTLKA